MSNWLKTSIRFVLFHLLIFTIFRLVFHFSFSGNELGTNLPETLTAFSLGFRFDLRFALILLIPFLIIYALFKKKDRLNFWVSLLYTDIAFIWLSVFFLDIGHFAYLGTRINGTVLQFFENPMITLGMMFKSYPMILILSVFCLVMFGYFKFIRKFIFKANNSGLLADKKAKLLPIIAFIVFFIVGAYGKISYYPLRWSEAFFSKTAFINHLSLNPVLYFFETLRFKDQTFDEKKVSEFYPDMKSHLEFNSKNDLSFLRTHSPAGTDKKMNVIVVVMESLAMHKTNLMNNKLRPTPYLEQIANESYSFSNAYTPTEGTARGVFGLLTGLPDVGRVKTSSRNPFVINQRIIMDQFEGYEKFYFIGGSANWANIRAVFTNNISGLEIYEEGSYDIPDTDVWGLSDLDLFIQTNKILNSRKSDKPFVAIVQAASFHRPYTIPENKLDFKLLENNLEVEKLKENGFYSMEQLNSLRFSDYSLGHYMKLAKESNYYKDTLFVITGDHGLPEEKAENVTAGSKAFQLEKRHVPIIFHNRKMFRRGEVSNKLMSIIDIFPSVMGLLNKKYTNYTLGVDVFNRIEPSFVFTFNNYSQLGERMLIADDLILVNTDKNEPKLYNYKSEEPLTLLNTELPGEYEKMSKILEGYYESSRYLLYNNKK